MILFTSCFLVSLVVILHIWKGVPIGHLTRDVTTIAEVPAYIGFFSQTGFLFWIATATLCLFSSLMKRTVYGAKHLKKFMFLAGLLTLLLCFDDMFLMHEQLFPSIGIPQKVVLITYGIITRTLQKIEVIILDETLGEWQEAAQQNMLKLLKPSIQFVRMNYNGWCSCAKC